MEDASDFSFEGARACHAVVLTTMEQDKCSWTDTHELDRFRRNHAQRHYPAPQSNRHPPASSNSRQNAPSRSTRANKAQSEQTNARAQKFCVYYNDGYCRKLKSHNSGGVFYKHLCENCSGEHAAVDCPDKVKN